MSSSPFLSIVIVNWQQAERLRRCLAALHRDLEASDECAVEVIVVDNASADISVAVAHKTFPGVRVIELAENVGFAAGCNAGIEASAGEWIGTLNNDTVVEPGWIDAIVGVARASSERCGMLQAKLVRAERPSIVDSTGVVFTRTASIENRDSGTHVSEASPAGEVFCPSAGAALYRRRMLDEVALPEGPFDGEFFMYFEDVDLGWRCRLAGWHANYVPDAVTLHDVHGTVREADNRFVSRYCARNRIRTVLRNGSAGFVLRASRRLVQDCWLLVNDPKSSVRDVATALRAGFALRRAQPARLRAAARSLETAWFTSR